jgi:pimeloyl-ACP methyl ester carboxylesterase
MKRAASGQFPQVILLIHGIRTHAWWMGAVKPLLEGAIGATVIPLKYGRFDLLRFWCPFGVCRNGPITRLHREIRDVLDQYQGCRLSVIAHSYGTYALARLLLDNSDVRLDRVILCGSIVPNQFPWSRITSQFAGQPMRGSVINECGTRDAWPVLAKAMTWGYGTSGTHGFGSAQVTDRFHALPHSGYFDKAFVKRYWLPFLARGEIMPSAVERAGTATPAWFQLLELPYKWLAVALAAFFIVSGSWSFVLPETAKTWACKNIVAIGGVASCGDIEARDITITGKPSAADKAATNQANGSGGVTAQGGIAAGGSIKSGHIKIGNEQ